MLVNEDPRGPWGPTVPSQSPDPLGDFPGSPTWQPRIAPTPPPDRRKPVLAVLVGVLIGLVVFGTTGFVIGAATADSPKAAPPPSPTPASTPTLSVFEKRQSEINRPKLTGILSGFGALWLPHMAGCQANSEPSGPKLNEGEDIRVFCTTGPVSVYFVQYKSASERDKARARRIAENVDARDLTAGAAAPSQKTSPSGRVQGDYIEFAYKASDRVVTGVYWDDTDTPVAAYMLAYWTDGLGESWEPLRDLYSRYA